MLRATILALCAAVFTVSGLAQTLYKSVGPDGKVTYSDHPTPEATVQKTMVFNLPPSGSPPRAIASSSAKTGQGRNAQAAQAAQPAAHAQSSQNVLFAASWCGFCKKAKAYLASHGIAYKEYDVDTAEGKTAFKNAGGGRGIPLLVAGENRIQGFTQEKYDAVFLN